VLAGIQVPDADLRRFEDSLKALGYQHAEESTNPAYTFFLT
jgi:threonine dehydratase